MKGFLLNKELKVAIDAVIRASFLTKKVFQNLITSDTLEKKDRSPVTVADYGAQAVVNHILNKHWNDVKIVGEEDTKGLKEGSNINLANKVHELTNSVLKESITLDEVFSAIDLGSYKGSKEGTFWTLDPIDGTKGFLRGGQYAVCLALIVDGKVELGVMGCPNLLEIPNNIQSHKGLLFIAQRGKGTFQLKLEETNLIDNEQSSNYLKDYQKIEMIQNLNSNELQFCESVESSHSNHDLHAKIANQLNITKEPIRMDSQCKYASISRNDGHIYLRLPVSDTYQEKIWDHAAGMLIVLEAGGQVTDIHGLELDFSKGRTLAGNKGVIASSKTFHPKVIQVVKNILNI